MGVRTWEQDRRSGKTTAVSDSEESEPLLRLYMPNIVSTDLVVFFFFLYLIRLTYDSHAVPMLLFSFHIMPHALLALFISVQCMAIPFFHSATAMRSPYVQLCFHFMAVLDAHFYLMLLGSGIF